MKCVRASTAAACQPSSGSRQDSVLRLVLETEPEPEQPAATMSIPATPASSTHYWPTDPYPQQTPSAPYTSSSSSATGEEGFVSVPLDDGQILTSTQTYGSTVNQNWYHDFRSESDNYADDMGEEASVGWESRRWCFWGFVVLLPLAIVATILGIVLYLWPMM